MRRRDFLALSAAAALKGADAPFRYTNLDHVEFTVADVAKARTFYARVFGNNVLKNNRTERRYVQVGASYIAFEANATVKVDHFSAGIAGYDVNALHEFLKQKNISYRDFPSGRDLNITDADGLRLQLSADQGWAQLAKGTASAEPVSGPPAAMQPVAIDHVLLAVSDVSKAEEFYQPVLGPVAERRQGITWFAIGSSHLGLREAGDTPGVERIGVRAAITNGTSAALEAAGAKIVSARPLRFRDPDGNTIEVVT